MGVLGRLVGALLGLWLADLVLVGVVLEGPTPLVLGGVVLGLAHLLLRPLLTLMMFPLTVLTLGVSLWGLNAGLLWAASWLVPGFEVRGAVPALLGAALISAVSGLTQLLLARGEDSAGG